MALLWIYVCFLRVSDKYWLMWIDRAPGFQKEGFVCYPNVFSICWCGFVIKCYLVPKSTSFSWDTEGLCVLYLNRGEKLIHCYVVFIPKHWLLGETPYSYLKLKKYQKGLGSQESNFSILRALGMRVPQTAYRTLLLQKSQKLKNCVLDRIWVRNKNEAETGIEEWLEDPGLKLYL